jgi:hypothetical protein
LLSAQAIGKLQFIHQVVRHSRADNAIKTTTANASQVNTP